MSINFIIADDENPILERTCSYIKKFIVGNHIDASVTLCTTSPQDVLDYSNRRFQELNVYILDINFQSGINGLTIGRAIRDREPNAYIIFLTAYIQLSMMVFKYRLKVFDFLVKPVPNSDLKDCLRALIEDYSRTLNSHLPDESNFIIVKSGYQEYHIPVNSILFIESFGPKLIVHTFDSQIECYDTLKHMEQSIKEMTDNFFRSHKSFLINTSHIKEVNLHDQTVIMSSGDKCLVSRSGKAFLKKLSCGILTS